MNEKCEEKKTKKKTGGGSSGGADYPLFCLGGTRRNELPSLDIVGLGMYWLIIGWFFLFTVYISGQ